MFGNSPEVVTCSDPPRQGNVKKKKKKKKKTFITKGEAWTNLGFAWVLLVLFTPRGEMISPMKYPLFASTVFCVLIIAVFFTWVSCLTPNLGHIGSNPRVPMANLWISYLLLLKLIILEMKAYN